MNLSVNGTSQTLSVEAPADRSLLSALRDELHLTGTKYGCGEGQCGACTVLIDGVARRSCQIPVSSLGQRPVTTIEGLARGDTLHPVQQAFLDEGAFQCGYCTPGMILSVVALLTRVARPTDTEIREALEGNLCRCGGYAPIIAAVHRAAETLSAAPASTS